MKTQYGEIIIINEDGKNKIDFKNSNFNSVMDFIKFLRDENLHKTLNLNKQ